jgi:hypothetical protein
MKIFNSIFFGGTGWNLLWSFGASKKLHELGFKTHVKKVGSISAGCMSALAFLDAASYEIGIVQCEQLKQQKFFCSTEFRKKYRYFFEAFANINCVEDINNSNIEYHCFYAALNNFPKLNVKSKSGFIDRDDLLTTCLAGCYIPFLFGIEPNLIGIPILRNGDLAIDTGCKFGMSTYRWDDNTLLVSPSDSSNYNIIGGDLSLLTTIGVRPKYLTDKELFVKGYLDASRWYAEYYLHQKSWKNQKDWDQSMINYELFKKYF